ncbi:MAG: helicase-associated domain-containing protein, partial [Myxococcota bacterium]
RARAAAPPPRGRPAGGVGVGGGGGGVLGRAPPPTVDALELNLLHLAAAMVREPLKLNKSGAPNRRSLSKFTTGLTLPDAPPHAPMELDLSDAEHLDYFAFLFSLGQSLEMIDVDEDDAEVTGRHEAARGYFCASAPDRERKLAGALTNLKLWSEVISFRLANRLEPDDVLDTQLSRTEEHGAPLIPARGYVFSVLRRARIQGWTPVEAVVDLCTELDRDYLRRVLDKANLQLEPRQYIHTLLERELFWAGVLELGESASGEAMLRFTGRGEALLGMKKDAADDEHAVRADSPRGCMIVQPNFEVMVFLDNASMGTLFRMYQVSERVSVADRVATFKLGPASVQRGYSLGMHADSAVAFFNQYGHTPLDATVDFQLRDWERLWKRTTLYDGGMLLRHDDPDMLDTVLGQLRHTWRDGEVHIERLTPGSAYIVTDTEAQLDRTLKLHHGRLVDYEVQVPACLVFLEPLVLSSDTLYTDFLTLQELEHIAEPIRERSNFTHKVWRLDARRIASRYEHHKDPLAELLRFLEARTIDGLPAEQALSIKALLGRPASAEVWSELVVVQFDDDDSARLFETSEGAEALVAAQFGPRAFGVRVEDAESLDELLERLGVLR